MLKSGPKSLAAALETYAADPVMGREQGQRARADCERRFGIDRCARAYVHLLGSLGAGDQTPTA